MSDSNEDPLLLPFLFVMDMLVWGGRAEGTLLSRLVVALWTVMATSKPVEVRRWALLPRLVIPAECNDESLNDSVAF